MPTNLPPEYFEADAQYRKAATPEEKIERLQALISTIPKHKGTDKLRADLRRKLSKLKQADQARPKSGRHHSPYAIEAEGAGTAVMAGPANAGRSSLLAALTNAEPDIAEYPFSTWEPMPGMMSIDNVQVQLVDTPALDREFVEPELLDLLRRCNLILIVVDLKATPLEQTAWTLAYLHEHGIQPLAGDGAPDQGYRRMRLVVNKVDGEAEQGDFEVFTQLVEADLPVTGVSASTGAGFEALRADIFEDLRIIRVYSKAPGQEADHASPFVLDSGSTVAAFAGRVHQDFAQNLKSARVWGSGDFEGQMVSRDHVLRDGDVVELRM